jgi:hypothetical protein
MSETWPEPLQTQLTHLLARRQRSMYLTIIFKLILKSRWKENELLWMQVQATNMTAAILAALHEEPGRRRDDGALALITAMFAADDQGKDAKKLRDILSSRFSRRTGFTVKDFPLTGATRTSVFMKCAEIMLGWYEKLIPSLNLNSERKLVSVVDKGDPQKRKRKLIITTPTLHEVYETWEQLNTQLQAAEAEEMPFGRNRGTPLGQLGQQRRDLRWIRRRLVSRDIIKLTLQHLAELLTPDPDNRVALLAAKRAFHPWRRAHPNNQRRRRPKPTQQKVRQNAVRRSYIHQHSYDEPGQRVRLEQLSNPERWRLREELSELLLFAEQFDRIAAAVDTLLLPRIPSFPEVEPFPQVNEQARRSHEHALALRRFQKMPRNDSETPELMAHRETAARNDWLKSASELTQPKLHPIGFTRTGRPPDFRSFALLFDRRNGSYALSIEVPGKHLPEAEVHHDYRNLYFVNFPETQFAPKPSKKLIVCALENGYKYHHLRFIRDILQAQYDAQEQAWLAQGGVSALTIEECLPPGDAPFSTAEITSRFNSAGYPEFYLHLPVPVTPLDSLGIPKAIIGLHEHEDGYSYAIQKRSGELILGDLVIPKWVDPYENVRSSDNYVFETAVAIVKLGIEHRACIGIENSWWKKRTPSLDSGENRAAFARPSREIAGIVHYKAALNGLLTPHFAWGVAPRGCGQCGYGQDKSIPFPAGSQPIQQRQPLTTCPTCITQTLEQQKGVYRQRCTVCERSWPMTERIYSCKQCGTTRPRRYNTALIVLHHTIEQLGTNQTEDPENVLDS